MRLLQDTLATAGRAETPPQSTQVAALASVNLPESVPAVPPKHSHSNPPAASPAPTPHTPVPHTPVPHTPVQHTPVPHTPVPHTPVPHTPVPHTPVPHTPAPHTPVQHTPLPSEPLFAAVPELLSLLLAQASTTTTTTTPTPTPIPAPPPLPEAKPKVQAEESELPAAQTSSPPSALGALSPPPVARLHSPTPDTARPEPSAAAVAAVTPAVAGREDDGSAGRPAAAGRDTGSTLLIQQTPEVIRVSGTHR